ncbi:MAG: hypothetical protein JST81_01000 [Bacteroidetes bacterium]|nr:hypothetical protein [Bacteroidota bacterium]
MKFYTLLLCFFIHSVTNAQQWYAEAVAGIASYNGDLTKRELSAKRIGPSFCLNLKYNSGDFLNFRAGLSFAKLGARDIDNPDAGLQSRHLSFKTNLYELYAAVEVNVLDPEVYYAYPYIFGGVGAFYFNPYTYTDDGKKVMLQPLGTEGQGLPGYPTRKKYSLIQPFIPFGGGFKYRTKKQHWEIGFEFGYRIIFTDYLDDVSKTYPNQKALQEVRGETAAQLSYRKREPFMEEGEKRGNSSRRDSYFFSGIKLAIPIGNKAD